MTAPIPIAFYAPMKSPHDPSPSGDRTMARSLMKALAAAGFAPSVASRLRTYEPAGDPERQRALRDASLAESEALAGVFAAAAAKPRLWFTYHSYYKAPDWLGPAAAARLGIPYVLAEGTRAGKRAGGPWALGHAGAEAALDRARAVFVMTERDRETLQRFRPPGQALIDLPPFLDLTDQAAPRTVSDRAREAPVAALRLLTVAMMRPGDKLASYRFLAAALASVEHRVWTLDIVGDGPARSEIERLFGFAAGRTTFHGRIDDPARLQALYRGSDLFVWPAVNEAYGMVLLEAQAQGCPVLAGHHGGVASALVQGVTGLLTPPGDVGAFASALSGLIAAPERLPPLSAAARRFVATERSLTGAAAILRAALAPLVGGPP